MKFNKFITEELKNPELKKAYDDLEPEFQIIEAIIDARYEKDMTQQELSNLSGIDRADISKLENGNANPTIETLKRLAKALDKKLIIQFK